MIMTESEFIQSEKFSEYIGDMDNFTELSEQKRKQVISSASNVKGVVIEPESGFTRSELNTTFETANTDTNALDVRADVREGG